MGQRLSGMPAGRPKERSRFIALLSLAALAAFFRLLLQAGRQEQTSVRDADGRNARPAGSFDSMADAEAAGPSAAERPSLRTTQPPVAQPARVAAPVQARRYGGTLGPESGRRTVADELAELAGPVAWNMEEDLADLADFPESQVAVIEPEAVQAPVEPVRRESEPEPEPVLPEVEPMVELLDDDAIRTLAQIEALPEIVEPRRPPMPPAPPVPPVPAWAVPAAQRNDSSSRWSLNGDLGWRLVLVAIAGVALALRLINHATNYDVFIDEITYSTIGQAVALGHGVSLYGTPFFLHPPLFFYLEGAVLHLFGGAHASPVQLVLELRPINCVIGAIECLLVMQLISRFTSRRTAVLVGIFVAVDPFLLLWDGRVLLETLAMTLAIAGWLCLDWIARVQASAADGDARGTRGVGAMTVLGGLLFGASLLSKETYAFVGVAPLLGMLVIGSPLKRRITGAMFGIAVVCYGIYLATVAAAGHLSLWWSQNSAGLQRAAGTKQITGFNQAGHHASLSSSISADLSLYLISYLAIMAVGLAALVGVVRWIRAARAGIELGVQRRLAIALGAGCVGYVGYAVVLGAFEVQIFYMCIMGGLPVLVTELRASEWRRLRRRFSRRTLLIAVAALASLALVFELSVDVRLRTEKDTSLSQLVNYVETHVPNGAMVDSTDQVTQFILQGVQIDGPRTVGGLKRDKPDYIVVDEGLVSKGYDNLGAGFQQWLNHNAHVVFSTSGRSTGRVLLYMTKYAVDQPES